MTSRRERHDRSAHEGKTPETEGCFINCLMIIGNLTKDPESRITQSGINVCSFTVAVNRRREEGTDYFRVTAWRQLAENCAKYLSKGKKVAVVGKVRCVTYTGQDGQVRASMEMNADEVEFLSPKEQEKPGNEPANSGYTEVYEDDLPF